MYNAILNRFARSLLIQIFVFSTKKLIMFFWANLSFDSKKLKINSTSTMCCSHLQICPVFDFTKSYDESMVTTSRFVFLVCQRNEQNTAMILERGLRTVRDPSILSRYM